ncbi:zeta toxin family protein [Danxiaibacter flavus]|uniref:Zeta toxin family protein n=1 Tax=Danxiaibacter flavus TaxID=3049108 RepID=A0ABV3ZGW9_9BACT|nr:zeta toxin family protein [Chitinophagaceae bacterium DXS]
MPNLFIISGCNGAGKTTSSFTTLPELLQIKEFVNADEIARGLSPFNPESVSIEAGRIMLNRLQELLSAHKDFAFETTLSTRSYIGLIKQAKGKNYTINLIYYWLDSVELAIERVKLRVSEGGHNIPAETIIRRYYLGLKNFLHLYRDKVDYWMLIDNSLTQPQLIAEGNAEFYEVSNDEKWILINEIIKNDENRDKRKNT